MESFKALVSGRVQGVGFRYFTLRKGSALGLKGYARNLPGGQVEVAAAGDRDSLEKLISELRLGPSSSMVTEVEVDWSSDDAVKYGGFTIEH